MNVSNNNKKRVIKPCWDAGGSLLMVPSLSAAASAESLTEIPVGDVGDASPDNVIFLTRLRRLVKEVHASFNVFNQVVIMSNCDCIAQCLRTTAILCLSS